MKFARLVRTDAELTRQWKGAVEWSSDRNVGQVAAVRASRNARKETVGWDPAFFLLNPRGASGANRLGRSEQALLEPCQLRRLRLYRLQGSEQECIFCRSRPPWVVNDLEQVIHLA